MKFEFFSLKLNNLSLNFGLVLTKTSLIVFIIFVGQLGYIVMSDSEKNQNIFIFLKEEDFLFFLVAKSEKTYKKYTFRTNRYL